MADSASGKEGRKPEGRRAGKGRIPGEWKEKTGKGKAIGDLREGNEKRMEVEEMRPPLPKSLWVPSMYF